MLYHWMKQYCSLMMTIYYLMVHFCFHIRLWVQHLLNSCSILVQVKLEVAKRQASQQSYLVVLCLDCLKIQAKYHGALLMQRFQNPYLHVMPGLVHNIPVSVAEFIVQCNIEHKHESTWSSIIQVEPLKHL